MTRAPQSTQGDLFGRILILSGPSGSGKSTLCKILQEHFSDIYFSISTTTRAPRESERDGVDYHFVSQEQFIADIKQGEFLEWAHVHNNYYGTALAPITQALEQGKLVVFDVDVQGHQSIKEYYGNLARSVFITTRSKEVLRKRLESRQTDSAQNIELRLLHAYNEMQQLSHFDYLIVNDDIQSAKRAIIGIATSLEFIPQPSIYKSLWQDVGEDVK
ncbi:guanylate kinase [Helicobacter sp.]|uniref:guanylate kinase n=1 Tax=Helicobacter sp. TaxID=218 RepID=UPI0025BF783F|nr:guanylate kinase [Helicobacter sp.]MBR2494131.1 guanylate kinase [Helicobacter sp.]